MRIGKLKRARTSRGASTRTGTAIPQYAEHRRRFAAERGLTLLPFPPSDELRFIDEYHYRAETQELIAQTLAPALA